MADNISSNSVCDNTAARLWFHNSSLLNVRLCISYSSLFDKYSSSALNMKVNRSSEGCSLANSHSSHNEVTRASILVVNAATRLSIIACSLCLNSATLVLLACVTLLLSSESEASTRARLLGRVEFIFASLDFRFPDVVLQS